MVPFLRRLAAHVVVRLPALLVLGLLGAVAFWGARHDWKFASLASLWGEEKSPEKSADDEVQLIPEPEPPSSAYPECPAELQKRLRFPSSASVRKAGIQVEAAQVRPLEQWVTATAMLDYQPGRYAQLTSPVAGRIWSVEKEIGEPVKEGEVLVIIDSAEVGQAKAAYLQSLSEVNLRKESLRRMQPTSPAIPDRTVLTEEFALRQAQTRLFSAQQQLLNLGLHLPKGIEDWPEEQVGRELRLLGLPDDIRHKRKINPETGSTNLLPLTAPFNGKVVLHPHAAPGEVVNTNFLRDPLFVIADVDELHIDLDARLEDVRYFEHGQKVLFVPSNEGSPSAVGELAHISPEVNDKTRTVEVHAEVANPNGKLRPHTFGTGHVLVRKVPSAVVVPYAAVQSEGTTSFVFVRLSDDTFQVRPIVPGLREDRLVEVVPVAVPDVGAAAVGLLAGSLGQGPLLTTAALVPGLAVPGVQAGDEVVTIGSYVLKSQLFKERITGGDE